MIDGAVAWTGGAGIEDHFEDGRFHDVMVRVTGDVVRQAQAAFLTSFRGRGGALPADLSHLFPEPEDAGSTPIALAQVLTGGFVAASQATLEQIDGARERLDVMNPYLTDGDAIEAIAAAARRGVRARVVVSERSNNHLATAALKHRYGDLIEAGVELWEMPDTVVHAKVVVADDVVSFGTVNLDAWALYRNSELMMIARSAELAAQFEERLFEPDIARAKPGRPPAGTRARAESWACRQARVLPLTWRQRQQDGEASQDRRQSGGGRARRARRVDLRREQDQRARRDAGRRDGHDAEQPRRAGSRLDAPGVSLVERPERQLGREEERAGVDRCRNGLRALGKDGPEQHHGSEQRRGEAGRQRGRDQQRGGRGRGGTAAGCAGDRGQRDRRAGGDQARAWRRSAITSSIERATGMPSASKRQRRASRWSRQSRSAGVSPSVAGAISRTARS